MKFWFFFFNERWFQTIKLISGKPYKDFEVIINNGVLTFYTIVQMLKKSTTFIISFVARAMTTLLNIWPKFSPIKDILWSTEQVLLYDIRVKYFRTFVFNVEVLRIFLVGISLYYFNIVFRKQLYLFLKS